VGALSPGDYLENVKPYSSRVFSALSRRSVPSIHFGTGTSGFLPEMKSAGGDVQSVDWRIPLGKAWEMIGYDTPIQGNLDPLAMMAPEKVLRKKVEAVLEQAGKRNGHIFNLGHGFLPQTPVESVEMVVELVHRTTSQNLEG